MLLLKRKTFDVEVDRPLVTADEAGVLAQAEDVIAAAEVEAAQIRAGIRNDDVAHAALQISI